MYQQKMASLKIESKDGAKRNEDTMGVIFGCSFVFFLQDCPAQVKRQYFIFLFFYSLALHSNILFCL